MDCKLEPAARTLLRIECLMMQGFLKGLLSSILSVLFTPFIPFVVMGGRWRMATERRGFLMRLLICPWWLLIGIGMAIATPFLRLWHCYRDVVDVCEAEWVNRWEASVPKMPDGHPYPIEDAADRNSDLAVTLGVLKDYNEEAKRFGQGIDIPPIE